MSSVSSSMRCIEPPFSISLTKEQMPSMDPGSSYFSVRISNLLNVRPLLFREQVYEVTGDEIRQGRVLTPCVGVHVTLQLGNDHEIQPRCPAWYSAVRRLLLFLLGGHSSYPTRSSGRAPLAFDVAA